MAKEAGLDLTLPEEDLLRRLSENALWKARYPVPMGSDKLSAVQQFSDGKTHLTALQRPEDVARVGKFLDRLRDRVQKTVTNGPE